MHETCVLLRFKQFEWIFYAGHIFMFSLTLVLFLLVSHLRPLNILFICSKDQFFLWLSMRIFIRRYSLFLLFRSKLDKLSFPSTFVIIHWLYITLQHYKYWSHNYITACMKENYEHPCMQKTWSVRYLQYSVFSSDCILLSQSTLKVDTQVHTFA